MISSGIWIWIAILCPFVFSQFFAINFLLSEKSASEKLISTTILSGLLVSAFVNLGILYLWWLGRIDEHIYFGSWLASGSYEIPLALEVDGLGICFALLASVLTFLVANFSRTYLHKEPGFTKFFYIIGLFISGVQLVAYSGSLDLMFAGWETVGVASTLFIAFFSERSEPLRSSIRALIVYRICDLGFLLGTVATHEWLGSSQLKDLSRLIDLSTFQVSIISGLFLISAAGKSALVPFSGWLARAMEGPTPSSALLYGGVSIHVGLFLLLRVWADLDQYPLIQYVGIGLGILTTLYAITVSRVLSDAKGKLVHATLAQVGLIFAEIAAGLRELALVHLLFHALLRVWQFLRAPNILHDSHRIKNLKFLEYEEWLRKRVPKVDVTLYALALHRWRLDEALDFISIPFVKIAKKLARFNVRGGS